MERFNEVILILTLYTMFCFTSWVPSIETKMKVGYLSCALVVLHFAVNLYIMSSVSCKNAKKNYIMKKLKKRYVLARRQNLELLAKTHEERFERQVKLRQQADLEGTESSSDSDDSSEQEDQSITDFMKSAYNKNGGLLPITELT